MIREPSRDDQIARNDFLLWGRKWLNRVANRQYGSGDAAAADLQKHFEELHHLVEKHSRVTDILR